MSGKYDLALDEARRGLDRQANDLSTLRDRSVSLLAIGGTLASILGGLAIRNGAHLSVWSWWSIGAFCGLATVSVAIMWPRRVSFTHDPAKLIEAADVPHATTDHQIEHLAKQMGVQYESNKSTLDQLVALFCFAVGLFVVEVIALLLDLRGRWAGHVPEQAQHSTIATTSAPAETPTAPHREATGATRPATAQAVPTRLSRPKGRAG